MGGPAATAILSLSLSLSFSLSLSLSSKRSISMRLSARNTTTRFFLRVEKEQQQQCACELSENGVRCAARRRTWRSHSAFQPSSSSPPRKTKRACWGIRHSKHSSNLLSLLLSRTCCVKPGYWRVGAGRRCHAQKQDHLPNTGGRDARAEDEGAYGQPRRQQETGERDEGKARTREKGKKTATTTI